MSQSVDPLMHSEFSTHNLGHEDCDDDEKLTCSEYNPLASLQGTRVARFW